MVRLVRPSATPEGGTGNAVLHPLRARDSVVGGGGEPALDYKASNLETRLALDELQRYLSDQLAPLMVTDSVSFLLDQSPELAGVQIQAWMAGQIRGIGSSVPVSSYLFHALKKIYLLGEFKLIPEARIEKYVRELSQVVTERYCPEEERTAELQTPYDLVCRHLLEKKKQALLKHL